MLREFMFATGLECSSPTIERGKWRVDQLRDTGHYRHWRRDLDLVVELGLKYLRYGPPLHLVAVGPGKYDWSFTDLVFPRMRGLGIEPIVDLCHFGTPDWIGGFQNPELPNHMAEYAAAFARRYPWVRFYTPVNEMYVTARESALHGTWNEQLSDDRAFVTAAKNCAKATILMSEAILRERGDAVFLNSESSEFYQPCCPEEPIRGIARLENQRRFIALDLAYGHPPEPEVRDYLFANGLTREEWDWFMSSTTRRHSILGVDYYEWNEKLIDSEGRQQNLGELFGWYVVTLQYYERYRRPLMHSETNCLNAQHAPGWLWRQWHNVELMRQNGVPVVGFTWYSLVDQIDWDVGLQHPNGNVLPVGLYDLNRRPRPVAQAYKHLVRLYREHTPVELDLCAPEIHRRRSVSLK